MSIKSHIRKLALNWGVEINRFNPSQSAQARLQRQLDANGVDLVVDVGANDGGYAKLLRSSGYTKQIVSFEPLRAAHLALSMAAQSDIAWHVAPRMALGDNSGDAQINVAANSTSSSLLPMLETHLAAAPQSKYEAVEAIQVQRLDQVVHKCLAGARRIFVKLDVQGYELAVLDGAVGILDRIVGFQMECSLAPLYEGQSTYRELSDWMDVNGFDMWGVVPGFTDGATGRMLQMDGVFFRSGGAT